MKVQHIKESRVFGAILNSGDRVCGKMLSLYHRESTRQGVFYVGLVIPKGKEPQAVRRNFLRRKLYAVLKECAKNAAEAKEIVVKLERNPGNRTRKSLAKEIKSDMAQLVKAMDGKKI